MKKLITIALLTISLNAMAQKLPEAHKVVGKVTRTDGNTMTFEANGINYDCQDFGLKTTYRYVFYFVFVDKKLEPKKVDLIGWCKTTSHIQREMGELRKELDKNYKIH